MLGGRVLGQAERLTARSLGKSRETEELLTGHIPKFRIHTTHRMGFAERSPVGLGGIPFAVDRVERRHHRRGLASVQWFRCPLLRAQTNFKDKIRSSMLAAKNLAHPGAYQASTSDEYIVKRRSSQLPIIAPDPQRPICALWWPCWPALPEPHHATHNDATPRSKKIVSQLAFLALHALVACCLIP